MKTKLLLAMGIIFMVLAAQAQTNAEEMAKAKTWMEQNILIEMHPGWDEQRKVIDPEKAAKEDESYKNMSTMEDVEKLCEVWSVNRNKDLKKVTMSGMFVTIIFEYDDTITNKLIMQIDIDLGKKRMTWKAKKNLSEVGNNKGFERTLKLMNIDAEKREKEIWWYNDNSSPAKMTFFKYMWH